MKKKVTISARLPDDVYKLIKKWAEQRHYSVNGAIIVALENMLNHYGMIKLNGK